jgi:hypothetical protein
VLWRELGPEREGFNIRVGKLLVVELEIICTLNQLLLSMATSRRMRWEGRVARTFEMKNTYTILIACEN